MQIFKNVDFKQCIFNEKSLDYLHMHDKVNFLLYKFSLKLFIWPHLRGIASYMWVKLKWYKNYNIDTTDTKMALEGKGRDRRIYLPSGREGTMDCKLYWSPNSQHILSFVGLKSVRLWYTDWAVQTTERVILFNTIVECTLIYRLLS